MLNFIFCEISDLQLGYLEYHSESVNSCIDLILLIISP